MIINEQFLRQIETEGALAQAAQRLDPQQSYQRLEKIPTWTLVCEEVIDTTYEPHYYERVVTSAELTMMRLVAWRTAGWLNYDGMLWDWVELSADDMRHAIHLQRGKGLLSRKEAQTMRATIARYE